MRIVLDFKSLNTFARIRAEVLLYIYIKNILKTEMDFEDEIIVTGMVHRSAYLCMNMHRYA
jgi:hypothetical protein